MPPNQLNFENLRFNSIYNEEIFLADERNQDENFFDEVNTQNFECSYLFQNEIKVFLSENENSKTVNAIHVNVRSLSKNFDNLLDILRDSSYSFNVLCKTETWCTDSTLKNNTNLHLPNFDIILQKRNTNKHDGGVLIYINKSLKCNLRDDLCLSDKDRLILTIEISKKNDKTSPKLLL